MGSMLTGKRQDYDSLRVAVSTYERNELRSRLEDLLKYLINSRYGGNKKLYNYLSCDLADFTARLKAQRKCKH